MHSEKKSERIQSIIIRGIVVCFLCLTSVPAFAGPVTFTDSLGRQITVARKPVRAVSLVPGITEIIFSLGAADSVQAVTFHDACLPGADSKDVVGGFFNPNVERVKAAKPDIVFCSTLQSRVVEAFQQDKFPLVCLDAGSISGSFDTIRLLGNIFEESAEAEAIVTHIQKDMSLIRQKVDHIPPEKRKRVIRLMGRDRVMTPGDDSFQNDMIRAAGGIAPKLNKTGNVVTVSLEEWQAFNPEVIYGCGGDRDVAAAFFSKPGWRDVDAVKNGMVFYFPCDLTCRPGVHSGYFVAWLSSVIYADEFMDPSTQVISDGIYQSRPLNLDPDYIESARIAYSHMHDFVHKTLIIDFNRPLTVVSTLEGEKRRVKTVGNHYSPPPSWAMGHKQGIDTIRNHFYNVIGKDPDTSSFLFTGADMDHVSIQQETFRDMKITALVTAGVCSNAVCMSKDTGNYYEPGTINIVLLPNMKLTPRAMTRAIISATEGKTAALEDMDIRSSYHPLHYPATGTGTDNILVAQGTGVRLDNAGGHCKLGELIARAVYKGVQEAVCRQNGLTPDRHVFQRLKERRLSPYGLVYGEVCDCIRDKSRVVSILEELLLIPRYAEFIEAAFAVSDDYENGLIKDLGAFESWCHAMAEDMAGRPLDSLKSIEFKEDMPDVLEMAFNALISGAAARVEAY